MNKSGTLIVSALMTFGLAAGAMAADAPKSVAQVAADAPAASGAMTDAPKHSKKHAKKHKKSKSAPSTTK